VKGPAARDDDSMAVLLRGIKADIARLSVRSTVPVGEGWRIEQRGQNLVAVLPGEDAEFVVASPGGECGKVLACLAGAFDGTLLYDEGDRVVGVRISQDAGNGLRTGEDGGLYAAAGGASVAEPVVVSGPYQAPGIVNGQRVYSGDWEDFPGSWLVPPGTRDPDSYEYSHPYFDDDLYPSVMTYDDQHADPRTGVSMHVSEVSRPAINRSIREVGRSFSWWLTKLVADPHWCKDWCEVAFTAYFTEWPPQYTDPRIPGSKLDLSICVLEFYPGASVWLTTDGYGHAAISVRAGPSGRIAREFGTKYMEHTPASEKYYVVPIETYGYTGRTANVPLNTLVRFRGVFRRGGESALYLYYGDPAKPGDEYDAGWTFGPAINFDWTNWTSPGFTVGTLLYEGDTLNRDYPYSNNNPLDYVPAVRVPEFWISNVTFKVDPVDDPRRGARATQGITWGNVGGGVQRAGANVARATVTIAPVAPTEGLTQVTKTDSYGDYTFYSVQLGTWKITATDGVSTASITRAVTLPWDDDRSYWNGDDSWIIALP
jgi:hypothetical protein